MRTKRGFRRGLLAVCALALVLRLVVIAASPHYLPRSDSADYDRIAVSLVAQHSFPPSLLVPRGGPSAFRAPLFEVALAGVYELSGVDSSPARWQAGRIFEALLGMLGVALVGLIAARLWGRGIGLLSGAIAAISPPLLLVGSSLMSEPLFIVLGLGAVLAALVYRESAERGRWALLAGVLVGCAALTRGNGIVLLVPVALLVWTGRGDRKRASWGSARGPALAILAAALTLVPWTVRNARVLHTLTPISTESGYALAGTYNSYAQQRTDFPAMWLPPVLDQRRILAADPNLNEAHVSSQLNGRALDYVGAHPGYVLKVAYWNVARLLDLSGTSVEHWAAGYEAYPYGLTDLSVYWFWGFGLIALAGALTRAARRAPPAFWGCPLALALSTVLIQGLTRYRAPADPFMSMLAALAIAAAWRRRRRARAPAPSPGAPNLPVPSGIA